MSKWTFDFEEIRVTCHPDTEINSGLDLQHPTLALSSVVTSVKVLVLPSTKYLDELLRYASL